MEFLHHPKFTEELSGFIDKCCSGAVAVDVVLKYHHNLLSFHFSGTISYTSKHLGMAPGFGAYSIYWMHFFIPNSGLSRTQHPKIYFLKTDSTISFLCLDSHIQNYKTSKLLKVALVRLSEIIEVLNTLPR